MQTKITTKLKKFISTLVCVMMVAGTFPVYALNSSVFAGNGVVYSTQTGAVPEIAEDIEGENAKSDDLNGGQAEVNGEQVVETVNDVQDVEMEGGDGKVYEVSNFDELKEKIEKEAKDGDTIKLTGNIDVNNAEGFALTVKGKKIKITSDDVDNPRTIECVGEGSLLKIEGEKSGVTLVGVKIDGCNKERQNSLLYTSGFLTLGKNTQIFECYSQSKGGAMCCEEGTVKINGGQIFNCGANGNIGIGGAIYCDKSIVEINQGTIFDCWAANGGVIYSVDSIISLNETSISKCGYFDGWWNTSFNSYGGAIYSSGTGEININGGKIFGCWALCGGAIYCDDEKTIINILDGEIDGCRAYSDGGAICCCSGLINMVGGTISNCTADQTGGAICCNDAKFVLDGGRIVKCGAKCDSGVVVKGGAILAEEGSLLFLKKGEICGNIIPNPEVDVNDAKKGKGSCIYLEKDCKAYLFSKQLNCLNINKWNYNNYNNEENFIELPVDDTVVGGYEGIYSEDKTNVKIIEDVAEYDAANDFKQKLESAADGSKIALDRDIKIPEYFVFDFLLELKNKKNITITSANPNQPKTITCENLGGLFKICEGSGVALENVKISGSNVERNGSLFLVDGGSLTLKKGAQISNCKASYVNGGAIRCINEGKVKMTEGEISDCYAQNGGAIYCENATLNMNGGEISNCHAQNGGAIRCNGGTVNTFGGIISGCRATTHGNAMYIDKNCNWPLISNDLLTIIVPDHANLGLDISPSDAHGHWGVYIEGVVANNNNDKSDHGGQNDDDDQDDDDQSDDGGGKVKDFLGLEKAIKNVPNGGTIQLSGKIEVTNNSGYALTVEKKMITIEGPGEIICKGKASLLKIEGQNSGVILKNVSISGNNIGRKESLIYTSGSLTLGEGTKICDCSHDGESGAAIYCEEGTVKINEGEISNCEVGGTIGIGGAIYCKESNVEINKGIISKCRAAQGGAIYSEDSTVSLKNTKIAECGYNMDEYETDDACGGAIYCTGEGAININGGTIFECWAVKGGAIYCEDLTVTLENKGKISKCKASGGDGGAIYCSDATLNMNEGKIESCEASNGGAIYCSGGTANILRETISGCHATTHGNAIYLDKSCERQLGPVGQLTINLPDNANRDLDIPPDYANGHYGVFIEGVVDDDNDDDQSDDDDQGGNDDQDYNDDRDDYGDQDYDDDQDDTDAQSGYYGQDENNDQDYDGRGSSYGANNAGGGDVNVYIAGGNASRGTVINPGLSAVGGLGLGSAGVNLGNNGLGSDSGSGGGDNNLNEINTDSNQIPPYENNNHYDNNENDSGDYDESAEESGNADNNSDQNNKSDFWTIMTPWLIGAAILAVGAAVVVAVMKNKKAGQV